MSQFTRVLSEITGTKFVLSLVCAFTIMICSTPYSPWLGLAVVVFLAVMWLNALDQRAEQKWCPNVFGENAYQILGVTPQADTPTLRAALRNLEREHHPNAVPNERRAEATKAFDRINKAYELLSDREKRFQYDGLLKEWHPQIPPFEAAYDQIKNEDKHPMYAAYDEWLADKRAADKGPQDEQGESDQPAVPSKCDEELQSRVVEVEGESAAAEVEIPESIREAMGLPAPEGKVEQK